MSTTPCHDTFAEATTKRQAHPLSTGRYKLRECKNRVGRVKHTVKAIGDYWDGRSPYSAGSSLGCCTTYEAATWLKRLPMHLAEMLAYDVLPAIEALTGDGVAETDVRRELDIVQGLVQGVLTVCDAHHAKLKQGIAKKPGEVERDLSGLIRLIDEIEDIVNDALALKKLVWCKNPATNFSAAGLV